MLAGIRDYSDKGPKWPFFIVRHDVNLFADCLDNFAGLGVIVCGENDGPDRRADVPFNLGRPDLPTIWTGWAPKKGVATVWPDYVQAGRKLAGHLLRRGFRQIAYFDARDMPYNFLLWEGVEAEVASHDIEPLRFVHGPRGRPAEGWRLEDQLNDLAEWLAFRETPLGLIAADDTHAQRAIEAAKRAQLKVPEDVAIVGVGNDEDFCQFASPSISSLDLRPEALGYEAAASLDRWLIKGESLDHELPIAPGNVIRRQSSDVLGTTDEAVVVAIQYIQEHIEESIRVEDLVEQVGISRSNLQRRFQKSLGYCPGEAIRRTRIDAVRRLLSETRLPLADVAVRCGFGHISQMSRDFKQAVGIPPSTYREQHF
jgi:LacI family transcriptional regulator